LEEKEMMQTTETQEKEEKGKGVKLFLGGLFAGTVIVGIVSAVYIHVKEISMDTSAASLVSGTDSVIDGNVIKKLQFLEDSIDEYYLEDVDADEMAESLYHGFVDGLGDPYSTYYSEEELETVMESAEGVYYGIGAYIGLDQDSGYCQITKVMDDSPALEAGLEDGDLIVAVDGEDMWNVTTSDIVTYIKGPEHSTVDIKVYREGETDYLDFTVERRKIETPTVVYTMDEDKIATIQITEFDEVTLEQFEDSLKQAKQEGMKGLILDLRDNPGGSLQTVVAIANHILPKGLVVYTEDRDGNRKEYTCDGKDELEVPLVVLVNGNSASASEILAGSIKDYKKGTILGTTTFGKGIVQKIFSISDGSAVKLTISHYYTPSGADIHGVGITPDEELELDVDAYKADGTDNQKERAKEILRSQIGE
jgi:carboxyl-terminal processing protease